MRIRRRPWARPELDACPFFLKQPTSNLGKWKTAFEKEQEIHLELGCGKGNFIAKLASSHPEINYIAMDLKSDMLGFARRKIEEEYNKKKQSTSNIILVAYDIERILDVFSKEDKIDRIYINFCNPWPRPRHRKRRLTHISKLEKYKEFLSPNAKIYFKTDDDALFIDSFQYFKDAGFNLIYKTVDLHSENLLENIITEHEEMYAKQGIKIKAAIFERREN